MDGIRKYSKEWFTLQGKNSDNYRNSISGLEKGLNSVNANRNSTLESSIFLGTQDEMLEKLAKHKSGVHGAPSSTMLGVDTYGAENIFNALDADGDGTVTQDEINSVAALNTGEFADKDDTILSTQDLALLYENAMDSVNASFIDMGAKKEFHYKNGDKTTINLANRGGLESKSVEKVNDDGSKSGVTYYYGTKSTTTSEKDSQGRLTDTAYKSGTDKTQNRESKTVYNDDGTRTVSTKTFIGTTTNTYDDNNKLVSSDKKYNYDVNGKIEDTSQASIGDCWVLSGVNSLRTSSVGEAYLKNAIKQNDDGSVTVTLKGVNKQYTYSAKEIIENKYSDSSKSFSTGDTDMNLLERAIGDYRSELIASGDYKKDGRNLAKTAGKDATVTDPLKGGQIDEAIYYITGKTSKFVCNDEKETKKMIETYDKSSNKYVMNCSFKEKDESVGSITTSHAYSITNVDEDNVYVVNPWDSSKEIAYPKDKFFNNAFQVTLTDLAPGMSETTISAPSDDTNFIAGKKPYEPKTKIGKFFQKVFS